MGVIGYDAVQTRTDEIIHILQSISTLIGPKAAPPLTVHGSGTIQPGLDMQQDHKLLEQRISELRQGIFTILILGDFNNGKSTLLNALLRAEALPVGATPTTGVITLLTYGENPDVMVYEKGKSEPVVYPRREFYETFSLKSEDAGHPDVYRHENIEYAVLHTQHRFSRVGVRLVDSPGLGEHLLRSQMTQNYLDQAQAVIVVLNAVKPLSLEEREFIEYELGGKNLCYTFFVFNRVNQLNPPSEIERVKARAERYLLPCFGENPDDPDRDLYERRVFFVDALGALEAGLNNDAEGLEASGFAWLERELEAFLTYETIFQASLANTVQLMVRIMRRVQKQVAVQASVITQPLDKLEARRNQLQTRLDALERQRESIEREIAQVGERAQLKLEISLTEHVERMAANWEADRETLINELDDIDTGTLLQAIRGKKSTRERIARRIQETVESYLSQQFALWSEQAQEVVKDEMELANTRLEAELHDFYQALNEIRSEFSSEDARMIELEQEKLIGDLTRQILTGGQSISGVIMTSLRRLFLLVTILMIATVGIYGWAALVALILVEVKLLDNKERSFKERIFKRIGSIIFDNLRGDLHDPGFVMNNYKDLDGFTDRLRKRADPLADYLWGQFTPRGQDQLQNTNSKEPEKTAAALSRELTRLCSQRDFYQPQLFANIRLKDETRRMIAALDTLPLDEIHRLNRRLMAEAYPEHLAPKLKDLIYESVQAQFNQLAGQVTGELRAQIDEVRTWMNDTISQLKAESFSVEQEQERLRAVESAAMQLTNRMSELVYGRAMDLDNLELNADVSNRFQC